MFNMFRSDRSLQNVLQIAAVKMQMLSQYFDLYKRI